MRRVLPSLLLVALLGPNGWLSLDCSIRAQEAAKPQSRSGLQRRIAWTTSRVKGTPDPPAPYRTEIAFPQLKFDEPAGITYAGVSRNGEA